MPDCGNPSPIASYLPIGLGPPCQGGGSGGWRSPPQLKSAKLACPIAAYLPIARLPIAIRITDCIVPDWLQNSIYWPDKVEEAHEEGHDAHTFSAETDAEVSI